MSEEILVYLQRIELLLVELRTAKESSPQAYYSTADAAKVLGKAEFTVREWCRLGRVNAIKRAAGRGVAKEWMLSLEEVCRVKAEGLLPLESVNRGRHRTR